MTFFRSILVISCLFLCAGPSRAASVEGIVRAVHEVELAFQLDGVVAKLLVKEGSRVRQGDALIRLDDTLQKLEVDRREAIFNDRAEIDSNRKNLEITKGLLDSARELYRKMSAVSRDEVMNLEMQYHSLAGKIEVAEAHKKQEQIELAIAKEMLSRYALPSPVTGTVTLIRREPGEWAKSGETIMAVVDTSVCHVDFNVEERHARTLRVNRLVTIRVREGDSLVQKRARIIYVAPVADKASALVRIRVEFENEDARVIPGVLAYMDVR